MPALEQRGEDVSYSWHDDRHVAQVNRGYSFIWVIPERQVRIISSDVYDRLTANVVDTAMQELDQRYDIISTDTGYTTALQVVEVRVVVRKRE